MELASVRPDDIVRVIWSHPLSSRRGKRYESSVPVADRD